MELGDLRTILRSTVLDDAVAPYLWADPDLNRYLNNAVREACIRARLLKGDADTLPLLCSIPIQIGVSDYVLDPAINVVRSGILLNGTAKLKMITSAALDKIESDWDNGTQNLADPIYLIMDADQNNIRLYPPPIAVTTLRLRVWRSPLDTEIMEDDGDEPCVKLLAPEELKHWAAYEAFMVKDSEQNDTERATTHLELFEAAFGKRPTQSEMSRWADSPPTRQRPVYF